MTYPVNEPYNSGYLDVGDGHEIYYEESGNPDGIPVVELHGGPGGGFSNDCRWLYDPEKYRLILFDQRGAGRSKPFASIHKNTISHLIDDIEKLREHLGVETWMVVGGSWGSALALLYTIEYSEKVTGLIVTGISLAEPEGINWILEPGGANRLMPDWYQKFYEFIPPDQRGEGMAKAYYNILRGPDDDPKVIEAAKRFDLWDVSLLRHNIREDMVEDINENPADSLALARIFFHYILFEYKQGNKWKILDGVSDLGHIPCAIIHGRYDLLCPAESAWTLHQHYPGSTLEIVQDGGHSILDPAISARVIAVTDKWADEWQR